MDKQKTTVVFGMKLNGREVGRRVAGGCQI